MRLLLFCFLFSAFCFSAVSQEFMQNRRKAFQPSAAVADWSPMTQNANYPVLAWWKGDVYTSGSWTDNSGNGYTATNLLASTYHPTVQASVLNGHSVLLWYLDQYLRCESMNWTGCSEWFLVYNMTNIGYSCVFVAVSPYAFQEWNNTVSGPRYNNASPTGTPYNQWLIVNLRGTNAAAAGVAGHSVYTNNVFAAYANSQIAGVGNLHIGQWSDGSEDFRGAIAEIILWKTNLTEDLRTEAYNGLKTKYGL